MEGITFIARSLGIPKNNILGLLFFLSDERKKGRNSPRNKDPGSLQKDLSQVMVVLSQLSKNTGGTKIMGMKGILLYCLYDLSSNNLY